MTHKLESLVDQAAGIFSCAPAELSGLTAQQILEDCDLQSGVCVYWGCWTEEELQERVG